MKYTSSNPPLVCMQTQSTCYKGTNEMTIRGVLWHSTGANNPTLKRYVQPSDKKPSADTYSKAEWLKVLGTNTNKNDMNHINRKMGMNAWIGKLANGSVAAIQTMPWKFKPWGCGSGSKGSCNDGWIQFEICEDGLTDKKYFNAVYKEACELTAYLCKMFNINPNGTVIHKGVKVPTIICHQDSYQLGLGGNHSDIYNWFPKHGKDMKTVRADVAALLGSSTTNTNTSATTKPATTTVKTYKVVTAINKYSTSADAIAQENAKKDKLAAGSYYIYNKYPDGYKGVYNITTDKTGAEPGSWINPKENILAESTTAVEKLYRVRKTKDDAKTQAGAFSSLDNAKDACQQAGAGYHVFDWNWKIVYSYTKPAEKETASEPAKTVAVYDLDYPEKIKIVDKNIKRNNTDCTKAIKLILSKNKDFDVEIAKAFFKLSSKYGIDPMMAISQSILETGWFNYAGSAVTADQHNYCGLGVTSTGVKGTAFDTVEDGVTAQLQHLFAYGCKEALPTDDKVLDPRFNLVTRGIAQYWQQLAGRWACPGYDTKTYDTPEKAMLAGNTYGQKIKALYDQIITTAVTEADVNKYFGTVEVTTPSVPESTKPADTADTAAKPSNNAIVDILVKCFSKLIKNLFNKGE